MGKQSGTVFYVDHCDTEALKMRWSTDANVDVSKLHVDAVWGGDSLREAIDRSPLAQKANLQGCLLDYIVASHVIEHVPDMITWLREIGAILKQSGTVRLAIPDKRYTFDIRRRTSSITDIVDAFV